MHRSEPSHDPEEYRGHCLAGGSQGHVGTRHILSGLRNGEFCIHYQPIVDLRSQEAIGLEAMLRWDRPQLGLLDPGLLGLESCSAFMREALERWVIYRASSEFSAFAKAGCLAPEIKLHVNVSTSLFLESSLPGYMSSILSDRGLGPERLCLNWTLKEEKQHSSRYLRFCKGFSSMGLELAVNNLRMDLADLNMFFKVNFIPFAMVKIGPEEAAHLETDSRTYESLLTFIRIFSGLGIKLAVKGVCTGRQARLLRSLCCHYAQGAYWHEPAPLETLHEQGVLGEAKGGPPVQPMP
jgi:EAL domain-containing protein (putative c-di-GMP-specific phosphodiesterase class I)